MFDALRRMIIPIITIVLVFFVGMIVLEWGLGFSSRQQFDEVNVAGVVNGEEVSWQTYQTAYDNLYRQASTDTDEELSDARVRQLQQQAWDQLVNEILLRQQVDKMQLSVTEDELYGYLRNSPPQEVRQMPYFQNEQGQFDYQKYLNAMADPQAAQFWNSLIPYVREDIRRLKLQEWILQAAHVTELEIRDAFTQKAESVQVAYVNVPYALYSSPPPRPTDEELQAYYEAHKDEYKVPERAKIRLAIIEKAPSEMDRARTEATINAIYDSIEAGADFAEMAMAHSEDATADRGGDLGWYNQGQMVQPFDSISFALDSGQVSQPFRTQFGWHIIKHYGYRTQDRKDPRTGKTEKEKQAHAAHILIKDEASRETLDEDYNKLSQLANRAKSGNFDEIASELGIEVKEPTPFAKGSTIAFIGQVPEVQEFAFAGKIGAVSEVFENNSALFVCKLEELEPAGTAPFTSVRERVDASFVKDVVSTMCADTAAVILGAINDGTSMKNAAEKHKATYEVSNKFTRTGRIEKLISDPVLVGAAFSMQRPEQTTGVINYRQGSIIMRLLERTQPDLSAYNQQRDSIRTALMTQKQQELYGRWFQHLKDNSTIVSNIRRRDAAEAAGELL